MSSIPTFNMLHLQDPLMQRRHPLALPEILINLRCFLGIHALTVCLRVCREWHRTLLPFIWHHIVVTKSHGGRLGLRELKNHADLVDCISVFSNGYGYSVRPIQPSFLFLDGLYCRSLTKLELDHQDLTIDFAAALIQQHHSTLKDFSYGSFVGNIDILFLDVILDALVSCIRLETLKLPFRSHKSLKWDNDRLLRDLWPRLRSLTASILVPNDEDELKDTTQVARSETNPEDRSVQSKLEYLALSMPHPSTYLDIAKLIQNSPGLKCLHWKEGFNPVPVHWLTTFLANAVRSGQWTPNNLESLELMGHEFSLQAFKTIIGATPELKKINVAESNFDKDHWHFLRFEYPRYLNQLRDLNIQDCWDVSGDVVQQILCEMPNLEHFGAPIISASDLLADKRPWTCSRLKSLMVPFFLDDETGVEEGSHIVLTQLAKMERLYRLELSPGPLQSFRSLFHRRVVEKRKSLELTLERGLGTLGTLTQLSRITGTRDNRSTLWTKDEAEWALSNWGCLMNITAVSMSKEASNLLRNAGVVLSDCITV